MAGQNDFQKESDGAAQVVLIPPGDEQAMQAMLERTAQIIGSHSC